MISLVVSQICEWALGAVIDPQTAAIISLSIFNLILLRKVGKLAMRRYLRRKANQAQETSDVAAH